MPVESCSKRPLLVLMSGKPGAGKSTLAACLADALALPLVSRDAIKMGLAETCGIADDTGMSVTTLPSVDVFYGTIAYLLRADVSLVAEQSFRRGLDERHFPGLVGLARTVIVHCDTSVEEARRRFTVRERSPHPHRCVPGAEGIIARMEQSTFDWTVFDPLDAGVPVLRVDTSREYVPGLDAIVAFCRGRAGP